MCAVLTFTLLFFTHCFVKVSKKVLYIDFFNDMFWFGFLSLSFKPVTAIYLFLHSFTLKNNDIAEVNNNHVTTRKKCLSLINV